MPRPLLAIADTEEDFMRPMDVNVKGTFLVCKHAVLQMKKPGGVIVNVSSVAALKGTLTAAPTSLPKAPSSPILFACCDEAALNGSVVTIDGGMTI